MRRFLMSFLIVLVAMAALLLVSSAAMAGISTSKHDFTTATGSATYKDLTSTATLCNTCHIPHHTQGNGRPLWNHAASTVVSYSWAEVTTIAGTTLPTTVGSNVSKACLSCHDGSVAVGAVLQGTSWGTTKITSTAKVSGTGGTGDLTGNHPVALPFPDQAGATYNSIVTKANSAKYKVPGGTNAKIYGTTAGTRGVECGSCHDPHDNTLRDGYQFLMSSQNVMCVECHIN